MLAGAFPVQQQTVGERSIYVFYHNLNPAFWPNDYI